MYRCIDKQFLLGCELMATVAGILGYNWGSCKTPMHIQLRYTADMQIGSEYIFTFHVARKVSEIALTNADITAHNTILSSIRTLHIV